MSGISDQTTAPPPPTCTTNADFDHQEILPLKNDQVEIKKKIGLALPTPVYSTF